MKRIRGLCDYGLTGINISVCMCVLLPQHVNLPQIFAHFCTILLVLLVGIVYIHMYMHCIALHCIVLYMSTNEQTALFLVACTAPIHCPTALVSLKFEQHESLVYNGMLV